MLIDLIRIIWIQLNHIWSPEEMSRAKSNTKLKSLTFVTNNHIKQNWKSRSRPAAQPNTRPRHFYVLAIPGKNSYKREQSPLGWKYFSAGMQVSINQLGFSKISSFSRRVTHGFPSFTRKIVSECLWVRIDTEVQLFLERDDGTCSRSYTHR